MIKAESAEIKPVNNHYCMVFIGDGYTCKILFSGHHKELLEEADSMIRSGYAEVFLDELETDPVDETAPGVSRMRYKGHIDSNGAKVFQFNTNQYRDENDEDRRSFCNFSRTQ